MKNKILIFIFIICFYFQTIENIISLPLVTDNIPLNGKEIFISESYGTIEKSSLDKYISSRLVILLKDAHCNYDAQHNIAKMLEVLVRDYKIDLVAVEGAVGLLDLTKFGKLPNEPARDKMAEELVKRGILTAPEYLSIVQYGKLSMNIHGIEDENLYIENFKEFRNTIGYLEEAQLFINEAERVVKGLKEKIYSAELLEFDDKVNKYRENIMPLTDWVKELNNEADKRAILLKDYPDLQLTIDAVSLEGGIDFKRVDSERAELISNLGKSLPKEELKEMVGKSLQFKLGKMSSRNYYEYLEKFINLKDIGTEQKYPNLKKYVQLVKLHSLINNNELFSEIDALVDRIKSAMLNDNIQKQLDDVSKKIGILDNLLNLTLNRGDLKYFTANREDFMPAKLLQFINIQAPVHGIPISMLLNDNNFLEKISGVIENGEKFYNLAVERDIKLVDKTLQVMDGEKKTSAVMVIGGFHTDGIVKIFEQKGVGYVVISPKIIKAEKEGLYISLMMDKRIQTKSSLAFPHLLAGGKGNIKFLEDLGAVRMSDDLIDIAMRLYNEFLGTKIVGKTADDSDFPFDINIDGNGRASVTIRDGFVPDPKTPPMLVEWFRMGLEEVINADSSSAEFLRNPENLKDYLNKTVLIEYADRTGGARAQGILRRATIGFISFYLGACKAYEREGLLGLNLPEDYLPETIKNKESGEGVEWPAFKEELEQKLKEKANALRISISDRVIDSIINYLFTMPAYMVDEGKIKYLTTFFNEYLKLTRDVFGVKDGDILDQLFKKLQAYRYLQTEGRRAFQRGRAEGSIRAQITDSEISGAIQKAISVPVAQNEKTVSDPLKRDLYVAALSRAGITSTNTGIDEFGAGIAYEKAIGGFLKGLPAYQLPAKDGKKRYFVQDASLFIEVSDGKVWDLKMPAGSLEKEIEKSNSEARYVYKTDAQKDALKKIFSDKGKELKESQFIHIDDYYATLSRLCLDTNNIVVTMLTNKMAQNDKLKMPIKGNRLLVGNEEGSDHMLMYKLALAVSETEDMVKQINELKKTYKDILIAYYRGVYSDEEIEAMLKDIDFDPETGIFKIILPKITPFVREYYDILQKAREIIATAA